MMPILSPLLEILATIMVAAGAALLYARRFQTVPGIVSRCYVGLLCVLMLTSAALSLDFETPLPGGPSTLESPGPGPGSGPGSGPASGPGSGPATGPATGMSPGQPPVTQPTPTTPPTAQGPGPTAAQALGNAHHITLVVLGLGLFCLALLVSGKPQALSLALLCILAASLKGVVRSMFLEPYFDSYKVGLATAIFASDILILALASVKKQGAPAVQKGART